MSNKLHLFYLFLFLFFTVCFLPFYSHGDQVIRGGEMIYVPEGEFIMGSNDDELHEIKKVYGKRGGFEGYLFEAERPRRKIYTKSFFIDKYEVTNAQYKKFIDAAGYPTPRHWKNGTYPSGKAHYPVLFVSWYDAKEYAKWAQKRLPTEAEWEKAARGSDGRVYPWGNHFDPALTSTAESSLENMGDALCNVNTGNRVGKVKGDVSPYGVYDMGGNVREWTDSWYDEGKLKKVIKGGSWVDLSPKARAANREGIAPQGVSHIIGFRCVSDYGMKDNLLL